MKLPAHRPALFVRGDLDGFFGLFIDNLIQLMLISVLCRYACGFPAEFIAERLLPGAAISILAGNLFYAWQARQLAERSGRWDVTALPFGINTISLLAFVFLVMSPVYYDTGDPELAWKVGLAACFISGLIETVGAFVGQWIKNNTPRAALLAPLAGIALSFMTLGFAFQIFASPTIAIVPMMLILIVYGARVRLPLRLPGGLLAVGIGVAAAWTLKALGISDIVLSDAPVSIGWNTPRFAVGKLLEVLLRSDGWTYIAVIAPIGLFNVINSIQNLESAEAAGDKFPVRSSMLVNGGTSLLAAVLGSPFPTSIYIGHPGWKTMGARTGYSVLNGLAISLLCVLGGISAVLKIIPLEAALGILLWIGLVMVAQAFEKTEGRHAIAVALGLFPPLGAWVLHVVETSLRAAGTNLYDTFAQFGGELYIHGIISLYQGFLLIALLFSAIIANVVDRRFLAASIWSFAASVLSGVGLIHAYVLTPTGIQNHFGWLAAPGFAAAYAVLGLLLIGLHFARNSLGNTEAV